MFGLGYSLMNKKQYCYPSDAAPASVSTPVTAWAYAANYTEVIAAGAITSNFWLVGIFFVSINEAGRNTQIKIGKGSAGSEEVVAKVPAAVATSIGDLTWYIPIDPVMIPANSRVAINMADNEAASNTHAACVCVKY